MSARQSASVSPFSPAADTVRHHQPACSHQTPFRCCHPIRMLKNILRAPALMHGSPTASATSIRGGHYQLILSSKAYKHKYTGVRTFLSDKERVRNFVRLLDPEERKALQEELNLQNAGTAVSSTTTTTATELPPRPSTPTRRTPMSRLPTGSCRHWPCTPHCPSSASASSTTSS